MRNSANADGYSSYRPKVTLYLLRYAQTLLTYAEAKARSGDLDESAFEMVNRVRRRANHVDLFTPSKYDLPPTLTAEQFVDSVVWERAWELAFEPDGRWFDLIRLNMRSKLKDLQFEKDFPNSVSSYYLTDDWYFYKIPEEDRWLNPNFK
ncbi:MAG TPA: RagB/SusD family nutrient uptake outer membrane protein [Prolixibacteraceae bacterium]|nr:RagB/SusD family nutrient uptake outer membrane protein [Prolixibacteraceae bacterium]